MKNCQKLQKFRRNYRKKLTKFKITFQKNQKKKTIFSKTKFIKKLNVLIAIFTFFLNSQYFLFHSRLLFVVYSQRNSIDKAIIVA